MSRSGLLEGVGIRRTISLANSLGVEPAGFATAEGGATTGSVIGVNPSECAQTGLRTY